jgi:hypothetical protein
MAGQYDLKKFLRHVSMANLKDYFAKRVQWSPGVPWEGLASVEPLFEAIRNAPEDVRGQINGDFGQINEMATEGGIRTLIDEGRFRGLDLGSALQGVGGLEDQALRVFLDYPAVGGHRSLFDVAKEFNRADNLPGRSWRKRSGVPVVPHAKSPDDVSRGAAGSTGSS